MDKLFGPLGKEWCVYFYILSIVAYVAFILAVFGLGGYLIARFNKLNSNHVFNLVVIIVNTFFVYIGQRLMHTMCIRSLL
jgi:Kef-type K+ transport system membrane component KefB